MYEINERLQKNVDDVKKEFEEALAREIAKRIEQVEPRTSQIGRWV